MDTQSTLPTFLDSLIREFPLMQRSLPIARPQNSPQKKGVEVETKAPAVGSSSHAPKKPAHSPAQLRARIGAVRAVPHISGPWLDADQLTVVSTPLTANLFLLLSCAPSRQPPPPPYATARCTMPFTGRVGFAPASGVSR